MIKVSYWGNADIGFPIVKHLKENPLVDLKIIVTSLDKPQGRKLKLVSPPMATWAKENQVPLYQCVNVNKEEDLFSYLKDIDVIIVFAFSHFLGQKWLNFPRLGCFNIHASLLPLLRGATPIEHALLNGHKKTGVVLQKMVKKMDAGDILASQEILIDAEDHYESLKVKIQKATLLILKDALESLSNHTLIYKKQDEKAATFAPLLSKQDMEITKDDSTQIAINKVKAFWGKFAWIKDLNTRIKVKEVRIQSSLIGYSWKMSDGKFLEFILVKPAGKNWMTGNDFLRGQK